MSGYKLEVWRESFTSLHGRGEWVELREATEDEKALGSRFWLPVVPGSHAYSAPVARRMSDRMARVTRKEGLEDGDRVVWLAPVPSKVREAGVVTRMDGQVASVRLDCGSVVKGQLGANLLREADVT